MTRPTPETLAHSARRARSGTGAAGDSDSAARPGRAAPAAATETPVREPATAQVSGAGSLVRSLEALGVDVVFGIPGGAILPAYDPLYDSDGPAHPGPPRAGRRARGHRLRAGHRPGRRLHRHLRPGRDQPGHPDRRRLHGLGADRRDHRPGGPRRRSARTPSRRPTSRASRCRSPSTTSWCRRPRRSRGCSPRRSTWPPPAGPARCWSTSPRTCCRRRPTFSWPPDARPARLPADAAPARQADPRGGPADRRAPAGRCSTSAAACSRPAPPRCCASWPS